MSLASMVGLDKLPPEMAAAMQPMIAGLEAWATQREESMQLWVSQQMKASLEQMNQIVQSAEDRMDGAQLVAVVTVKLPQRGSQMAEVPK